MKKKIFRLKVKKVIYFLLPRNRNKIWEILLLLQLLK
jgi:hypothetical protein